MVEEPKRPDDEEPEITIGFIRGKVSVEGTNGRKPIEGVRITTNDSATYTDEKGEYLIGDRVCLNPHILKAYHELFKLYTQDIALKSGGKPVSIDIPMELAIPGCISGKVIEYGSIPIKELQGASVHLASPTGPSTTSASDGSYALSDPLPGYYLLTAKLYPYKDWNNNNQPVKLPSTKTIKMKR